MRDWQVPIHISEPKFELTLDEVKSLYSVLKHEYLPKEPYERYEHLMRLMNGFARFIDDSEKTK